MKRLCTCIYGATSMSVLVSLGLMLGLSSTASAGNCTNDAGVGDYDEGESCSVDLNDDNTNGGCNSFPEVFSDVACGDVVCGKASTFLVNAPCTPCTIDDDCTAGDTCVGGICADACDDSCTVDTDCPDGATCNAGFCTISTCPEGQSCDGNGVCTGGCPNAELCNNDTDGDGEIDACSGPTTPQMRRDTDWYRMTYAELQAADADANGIVQISATVTGELGANLVTFLIGLGPGAGEQCEDAEGTSTVTFPGSTGYYNGDPANNDPDPLGCGQLAAGTFEPTVATLVIDDYPNGIVIFVASGECDGSVIVEGLDCAGGKNDYNLQIECIEPPTNCNVTDPDLGPCNEANPGVGGCDDPECCKLVCDPELGFNALCCLDSPLGWIQQCATAAIDLGCAPELGSPVCMSTGNDNSVDGYLRVCADPYGALSSDGFCGNACDGDGNPFSDPLWGDEYNPVGALDVYEATFTHGFYLFDAANQYRELLANILQWTNTFLTPDTTLGREIIGLGSTEFDENPVDGITDKLTSEFNVTGGLSINFVVEQTVETLASGVAILTQTYDITNTGVSALDVTLLKALDADLYWTDGDPNTDYGNDNVGTNTNGYAGERHVYEGENANQAATLTISSPQGTYYYGGKNGVDPDGPGGPALPFGFGTDSQQWDQYGVPVAWQNFIAGVGYDVNGASGDAPAGSLNPADASIGLVVPVQLSATGPSSSTQVVMHTTYGSAFPLGDDGGPPCPWDCDGSGDGFSNVSDLLQLLGEYDVNAPGDCTGGTEECDYDSNGCVDVVDLLKLLSHYSLEPDGSSCP